ncbi:hypothetical protein HMPREF9440_01174 [Sutterella parvirubra YIT 11816]|uniref:Uncharacterized protein n=1 Tax=Sutterella parvirubra YIT 11816 TaxID=762967 RepID=H3KEL0_9BURK|nr:hypothetical protein HMPREF9440_01174 [Sutterella parvirubra YIT 11816]
MRNGRKVKDKAGSVFGPTASTTLFRRRRRPFCQGTGTNEKSADSIVRVDALSEGFTSPVRRCVETPSREPLHHISPGAGPSIEDARTHAGRT